MKPHRRPPPFFEEAIVTAVVHYGESDAIVHVFTKARGKLSAFARAARKSKRRFGASLFPGALGVAELREKKNGFTLEGFEANAKLFGLSDPHALGRASYLVEVSDRLLADADPMPDLYDWLSEALEILMSGEPRLALLRAYELQVLNATGYLPDLDEATDIEGEVPCAIQKNTGALIADPASHDIPFGETQRTIAKVLIRCGPSELPEFERDALAKTGRLFATHLRRMGIDRLRSIEFLRDLATK